MSFYSKIATTAEQLISRYGRNVSVRQITKSGTAYDPTVTPSDTTVKAVSANYTTEDQAGTQIQQGDIRFYIKTSIAMTTDMQIVDDSNIYSIIDVNNIKPGDTQIIYIIQARLQ